MGVPNTFVDGTVASASEVNANFTDVDTKKSQAINRKDITTNSSVTNQRIQFGWNYFQGTAAINASDTFVFPVAFTTIPIVIVVAAGYANSAPDSLDDLIYGMNDKGFVWNIHPHTVTETGFQMHGRCEVGYTFVNTSYFGYSWIAIGT